MDSDMGSRGRKEEQTVGRNDTMNPLEPPKEAAERPSKIP